MPNKNNIFIGLSAEYFVAAELSRRYFSASVTLKNTPGIDIIAINPETEKMFCIQVKAKSQTGKRKEWLLDKKDEQVKGDNFFYAFVNLNMRNLGKQTEAQPDIYIIPAKVVAKQIKENDKKFTKKGGKVQSMRVFKLPKDDEGKYQNWDILK